MPDILQFYHGSSNTPNPGKGVGESVEDVKTYKELSKITNWRRILSNRSTTPFELNGHWESAEDAIKAGQDPLSVWRAKFSQNEEAARVLKLTGNAELWHSVPRSEKERWTGLEEIRDSEAQRNLQGEQEMSASPKKKNVNAKANAKAKAKKETVGSVPEGTLSVPEVTSPEITLPDLTTPEETDSTLKFCNVCDNYLYMQVDSESQSLTRLCRKCGYKENDVKGGLVMEMRIQEDSAEGYKILLNEFTRKDPRLPHIRKNISCPNVVCESNHGKDPDVIYIKYDLVNMMYLYICDICGEKWHSRSRS